MLETFLIPERAVEANGEGPAIDLGAAAGKKLLVTLNITRVIEQQSLDVGIWGSADGADWSGKAILDFPQKFYAGTHQLVLNLGERPAIKFLRAKWTVNRWGKGAPTPRFTFSVAAREVAARSAA